MTRQGRSCLQTPVKPGAHHRLSKVGPLNSPLRRLTYHRLATGTWFHLKEMVHLLVEPVPNGGGEAVRMVVCQRYKSVLTVIHCP